MLSDESMNSFQKLALGINEITHVESCASGDGERVNGSIRTTGRIEQMALEASYALVCFSDNLFSGH